MSEAPKYNHPWVLPVQGDLSNLHKQGLHSFHHIQIQSNGPSNHLLQQTSQLIQEFKTHEQASGITTFWLSYSEQTVSDVYLAIITLPIKALHCK